MGQDFLEIIRDVDMKSLEIQLALQCAPLITGLKISNMLIIPHGNEKQLKMYLYGTGISYYRLLQNEGKDIYILFRRAQLEAFLLQEEVRDILVSEGYQKFRLGNVLSNFRLRYRYYMEGGMSFPHEIGVLLGYPAEDVRGFIENGGKNFLYSGYWKVYADKEEKINLFHKFDAAKAALVRMLSEGAGMKETMHAFGKNELQRAAI